MFIKHNVKNTHPAIVEFLRRVSASAKLGSGSEVSAVLLVFLPDGRSCCLESICTDWTTFESRPPPVSVGTPPTPTVVPTVVFSLVLLAALVGADFAPTVVVTTLRLVVVTPPSSEPQSEYLSESIVSGREIK